MNIAFILPGIPGAPTGGSKIVFEYSNWLQKKGYHISIYYIHDRKIQNPFYRCLWRISLIGKALFRQPRWFELNKDIKRYVIFSQSHFNRIFHEDVIIATAIETVEYVHNLKLNNSEIKKGFVPQKVYFIQDFEIWDKNESKKSTSDNSMERKKHVIESYSYGFKNIVVSEWLRKTVELYSNKSAYLVSNGINNNIFYDRKCTRISHSLIFHYRSAAYKGAQYAIDVIMKLTKIYADLQVFVVSIEGNIPELPSCCTCYNNISAEQIAELNNKSLIFMCTSLKEGFGLPGLEAMACGCALVSSMYEGVMEYAINGVNALLSPIKDVESMVRNIISLFEDSDLRNRITENGIKTSKERTVEKAAQKFEHILLDYPI